MWLLQQIKIEGLIRWKRFDNFVSYSTRPAPHIEKFISLMHRLDIVQWKDRPENKFILISKTLKCFFGDIIWSTLSEHVYNFIVLFCRQIMQTECFTILLLALLANTFASDDQEVIFSIYLIYSIINVGNTFQHKQCCQTCILPWHFSFSVVFDTNLWRWD